MKNLITSLYIEILEEMKQNNSVTKTILYTFVGLIMGLLLQDM